MIRLGMFAAKFAQKSAANILQTMNNETQADMPDRYATSKLLDQFLARKIAKLPLAADVVVKYVCSLPIGPS